MPSMPPSMRQDLRPCATMYGWKFPESSPPLTLRSLKTCRAGRMAPTEYLKSCCSSSAAVSILYFRTVIIRLIIRLYLKPQAVFDVKNKLIFKHYYRIRIFLNCLYCFEYLKTGCRLLFCISRGRVGCYSSARELRKGVLWRTRVRHNCAACGSTYISG